MREFMTFISIIDCHQMYWKYRIKLYIKWRGNLVIFSYKIADGGINPTDGIQYGMAVEERFEIIFNASIVE